MKTVADLKRRLIVGTFLTLDSYTVGGQLAHHPYLGVPREVTLSNSVGFASKPADKAAFPNAEASHCDWPKKAGFTPDADGEGFGLTRGHIYLHYRLVEVIRPYFRVFPEGEVVAIWGEPDGRGFVQSYQHVGQHSDAHPVLLTELRQATPEESAPLRAELQRVGYVVL